MNLLKTLELHHVLLLNTYYNKVVLIIYGHIGKAYVYNVTTHSVIGIPGVETGIGDLTIEMRVKLSLSNDEPLARLKV